jgi:hypothetical protein
LRAHWTERDPAKLWQTYTQLTEAEAAFRTLKGEVKVASPQLLIQVL